MDVLQRDFNKLQADCESSPRWCFSLEVKQQRMVRPQRKQIGERERGRCCFQDFSSFNVNEQTSVKPDQQMVQVALKDPLLCQKKNFYFQRVKMAHFNIIII